MTFVSDSGACHKPCQTDGPLEMSILLLSHGKLEDCIDELSNFCAKTEMIGPSFRQVTGQARVYMNLYKQNTSPG